MRGWWRLRSRHRSTTVDEVEVTTEGWKQGSLPTSSPCRGGRRAAT
jgi:hypothetical protein